MKPSNRHHDLYAATCVAVLDRLDEREVPLNKLVKLVFLVDFFAMNSAVNRPAITGLQYVAAEFGPVPSEGKRRIDVLSVLREYCERAGREMSSQGDLILWSPKPKSRSVDAEADQPIRTVLKIFGSQSSEELTASTHELPAYIMTPIGGIIEDRYMRIPVRIGAPIAD
jgi:hypothetical protein